MELWIDSQIEVTRVEQEELVAVFRDAVEELVKAEASWRKKLIPGYMRRLEQPVTAARKELRSIQRRLRALTKKAFANKRIAIDEAGASLRSSTKDLSILRATYANIMGVQATGINVRSAQLHDFIGHCLHRGMLSREKLLVELGGPSVASTPPEDKFLQQCIESEPEKMLGVLKKLLAKHQLVAEGSKANLFKLVNGDPVSADELD